MPVPPVVLFEDEKYVQLLPLAYFRPVWELRCGIYTLEEKLSQRLNAPLWLAARHYLEQNYLPGERILEQPEAGEEVLLVNGRLLAHSLDIQSIFDLEPRSALVAGDNLVAARIGATHFQSHRQNGVLESQPLIQELKTVSIHCQLVNFPWDLIALHPEEMLRDFQTRQAHAGAWQEPPPYVHVLGADNVLLSPEAVLKPGVVLDAEEGPVVIEKGARVLANAAIQGPVWIGQNSQVKMGAKIYHYTAIGPVCKVGGEVECSILQGYANKQHEGFLGHAYLGAWVNLGADTNNSDLKNNYGSVKVFLNGQLYDTGLQFLGLIMGDHSKTAINTMFNTGTIVGVNCNIFGAGMPPRFIPSFSWGGAEGMVPYQLDKAMEVARRVMARRNVDFGPGEQRLFQAVWNLAQQVEVRDTA